MLTDDKTVVTKQQRKNAVFVRDVMWPSIPKKNVIHDLESWRGRRNNGDTSDYREDNKSLRKLDCKTVACLGGWVAVSPYFKKQGVEPNFMGVPIIKDKSGEERFIAHEAAWQLFGDHDLFDSRKDHEKGSDWKIAMKRIKKLIRETRVED